MEDGGNDYDADEVFQLLESSTAYGQIVEKLSRRHRIDSKAFWEDLKKETDTLLVRVMKVASRELTPPASRIDAVLTDGDSILPFRSDEYTGVQDEQVTQQHQQSTSSYRH